MNIEDINRLLENCLSKNNKIRQESTNNILNLLKNNKSKTIQLFNQIISGSLNDKILFVILFLKNTLKNLSIQDIKQECYYLTDSLINKLEKENSFKFINACTDLIAFLYLKYYDYDQSFNIYNEFLNKFQKLNFFKQSLILMKICERNNNILSLFNEEIKKLFSEKITIKNEINLFIEELFNLFLNNAHYFKLHLEDLFKEFIENLFKEIFPQLNINENDKLYFYLGILHELIELEVLDDKERFFDIYNYLQNLDKKTNYYKIKNQIFDTNLLLIEKNFALFNNENVFYYLFEKIVYLIELNYKDKENEKIFKIDRIILNYVDDILSLLSKNKNLHIFSGFIINTYNKNTVFDYFCSYILLSQIGEYLENYNDIKPIFLLIQKDYNNENIYVRYAIYLCISQLSIDMKPFFQQEFYFQVIDIINDNINNENEELFPYLMKSINCFISGINLNNEFFKENFEKIYSIFFDPLFDKIYKIKNIKILKYCYKFILIFTNILQYNIIYLENLNDIFQKLLENYETHFKENKFIICSLNLLNLANLLYFSNEEYFNLYNQNILNKTIDMLKINNYEINKDSINLYNTCNFLIPIIDQIDENFINNLFIKINECIQENVNILKNKELVDLNMDYFILEVILKLLESIIVVQKKKFISNIDCTLKNILNFINISSNKNIKKISTNIIMYLLEIVEIGRNEIKRNLCKFLFKIIGTSIYIEFEPELIGLKFKLLYKIVYRQMNLIDKNEFEYFYNFILNILNKMNLMNNNFWEEDENEKKFIELNKNLENLDIILTCFLELCKNNEFGDMFYLHFFYEYSYNILINNKNYPNIVLIFSFRTLYYFLDLYQFKNIKFSVIDILEIIKMHSLTTDLNFKNIWIKLLNILIPLIENNITVYYKKIIAILENIKNSNVKTNYEKELFISSELILNAYGILIKELFKYFNEDIKIELKNLIDNWITNLPLKILKSESIFQNDLFINISLNFYDFFIEDSINFLTNYLKIFYKIYFSKNFAFENEMYFRDIILILKNYQSFNESLNLLEDYNKEFILKIINESQNNLN